MNTTPSNILITVIIFGMVLTGTVLFWGDLAVNYDMVASDNFSNTLNKLNDTMVIVNNMDSASKGNNASSLSTTEVTWYDTSQSVVYNFIQAIKLTWNMGGIISAMISDLAGLVGLPAWFINGLLAILVVVIIGAIYYALTGRLF